jgi:hypothetical protein
VMSLSILHALLQSGGFLVRHGLIPVSWTSRWVYIAKLAADGLCFIANFLVMKLYVFSDRFSLLGFVRSLFRISRDEEDPEVPAPVQGACSPASDVPHAALPKSDA